MISRVDLWPFYRFLNWTDSLFSLYICILQITHYMAINRLGNTQLKWDSLSFEITWADHVTFFFSLRFLLISWTFSTFFRYVFWLSYLYFTMPKSVSSLHKCFPFSSLIHSLFNYLLIPYICRCYLLFIYLFYFIFAFSLLTVLLLTL